MRDPGMADVRPLRPLRAVPDDLDRRTTDCRPPRSYAIFGLALVGLLLAAALVAVEQNRTIDSVRLVPVEVRAGLLQDGLTNLRSTCLAGYAAQGPLRDYCIDQAHFVVVLPECGPDCRAAAGAVLPHARR
jgi:hypothetical protein